MSGEPLIPLANSEVLFVVLGVVTQELEKEEYPGVNNLHMVLGQYVNERDRYLLANGMTEQEISMVTAGAIEGLNDWLEDSAEKAEIEDLHLSQWEEEMK